MDQIVKEDISGILKFQINWDKLKDKTVLVTGATGMIGQYLVISLLELNKKYNSNIQILALCRNREKGMDLFKEFFEDHELKLIVQDVTTEIDLKEPVGFVFHTASPANPKFYSTDPVGTILANTIGTKNALEVARINNAKFCYISTMEVYGEMQEVSEIKETEFGAINPLESRSCYPESKRLGENLCVAYHEQYGVDIRIIRPAYTYGPGMSINDSRVQCEFMRKVIHDENIVMKSDGSLRRTYTYVADVISGIFMAVLNGEDIVYNVADAKALISIRQLAETIIASKPGSNSKLEIKIKTEKGWSSIAPKIMDCSRLKSLGWQPMYKTDEGIHRAVTYNLRKEKEHV